MTKKLLSLPPNLVDAFHEVTGLSEKEYFCTSDPIGARLGSGGGTTWLLEECHRNSGDAEADFAEWLSSEKRILLHAGGQSRRLPSYAPSGKILTPVPIFRWERGQKLSQTLLDLQLPLYERIMRSAPEGMHTLIVSGDVYIHSSQPLPPIPEADVVCYGLWLDASIAKNHGVFYSRHDSPSRLDRMLQKPSVDELNGLLQSGYYLTDIGVWLLSDRAVEMLRRRSRDNEGRLREYDLYSEFGGALGTNPTCPDPELSSLSVAIVPLPGGEFYHYGTSREMISSTLAIQNRINDQREIMHRDRKPHPSIFVQNSVLDITLSASNNDIWVENSHIASRWTLTDHNIVTGVPRNDWDIALAPGKCVDIVPIGADAWAVRVYDIDDRFAGAEQQRGRFPVVNSLEEMERAVKSLLAGEEPHGYERLMSAEEISNEASLPRLVSQRREFRRLNWTAMAANHAHSVFYQLDLHDAAGAFATDNLPLPAPLDNSASLITRMSDAMFRAEVCRHRSEPWQQYEQEAFGLLREGLTSTVLEQKQMPRRAVCSDQIVWSRSPVRIDIAGGWTDTPPFCLMEGGNVINLAIELNGQPPLQAYVRPCAEPHIVCRSIDLVAAEIIETEITLFSAIPAGSGLGTSSILASTVLGAISDFCALAWDKTEICKRTLILEQLLTTGGGWQDQYGGVIGGVKLLQSTKELAQEPLIRRLPSDLFTDPQYAPCHLLFYTGITRTAKDILAEIVRRMFLNHGEQIGLLREMKNHTMEMYDAIQRDDFARMGRLVRRTWQQNMTLDHGTNPPGVDAITRLVDDLCLGYKLPGAGGGGYLYMIAKEPEAAGRIRHILTTDSSLPANSRMVEMSLSHQGLQITRS